VISTRTHKQSVITDQHLADLSRMVAICADLREQVEYLKRQLVMARADIQLRRDLDVAGP
jgi:hypothetical protein